MQLLILFLGFLIFSFSSPLEIDEQENLALLEEMKENILLGYGSLCQEDSHKHGGIKNWDCFWCKKTKQNYTNGHVSSETNWGTRFFDAIRNNNTLIISFRGSQDVRAQPKAILEWVLDIDCIPRHLNLPGINLPKNIKVHEGFLRAYKLSRKEFLARVEKQVNSFPIEEIYFVGHSLGGCLNEFALLDLITTTKNEKIKKMLEIGKVKFMSFGSPRVGNKFYSQYFQSKFNIENYYRVVNHLDLIPSLPFRSFGYTHHPREYWFGHTDNYQSFKICSKTDGEDVNCSAKNGFMKRKFKDHNLYLGQIEGAGKKYGCM